MNGYCKDCRYCKFGYCTLLKIAIDPFDTCRWYEDLLFPPLSKENSQLN